MDAIETRWRDANAELARRPDPDRERELLRTLDEIEFDAGEKYLATPIEQRGVNPEVR